jgi:hypothetical protein
MGAPNLIGNQQFLPLKVAGGQFPPEGPRAVRIYLDFTTNGALLADLSGLVQGQPAPQLSYVQTLFVDNSANANPLVVTTDASNQKVIFPAYSQGYMPILQPNFPKITFNTTPATGLTFYAFALNFPVTPSIWSATVAGGTYSGGKLQVTDVALDALINSYHNAGSALAVADLSAAQGSSVFSAISAAAVMNLNVSTVPCVLDSLQGFANVTAEAFIKIYDSATTITPGTGTPVWRGCIPGANQGAGASIPFPRGLKLANGLQVVMTLGMADSDTTALTANNYLMGGTYHS